MFKLKSNLLSTHFWEEAWVSANHLGHFHLNWFQADVYNDELEGDIGKYSFSFYHISNCNHQHAVITATHFECSISIAILTMMNALTVAMQISDLTWRIVDHQKISNITHCNAINVSSIQRVLRDEITLYQLNRRKINSMLLSIGFWLFLQPDWIYPLNLYLIYSYLSSSESMHGLISDIRS